MTKLRMSRIAGTVSALLLLTVSSAVADECSEECHKAAMKVCGSCEYGDATWKVANAGWEECQEDCDA